MTFVDYTNENKLNQEQTTGDKAAGRNSSYGENQWGYDLYPDRTRAAKNTSVTDYMIGIRGKENIDKIKCERNVYKCVKESPLVKLMIGALKSSGCAIDIRRHISCEECAPTVSGGYDPILNQLSAKCRDIICFGMRKCGIWYAYIQRENFNGRRAHRRYLEMYPNRRQPDFKIFKNLYDRLGETGSFRPKSSEDFKPRAGRRNSGLVAENSESSTRHIAMETGVSKSTVWKVLKKKDPQTYPILYAPFYCMSCVVCTFYWVLFELPTNLNGELYLDFLQTQLPNYLDNLR
ncbi:hypothetical protein NQ318_010135 [Aromia moschata]|uniref:Mitochondrial inner membrane protease ATP23 n=1 Tax=Aromia moschata TaxID=1265417 RepID=A0AAV8Y7S0_9CUCU|nr:hypothetical protein NQ318_010135 [Aromia moschata]